MTGRKVKFIALIFLVVSLLGFADAAFLTVKHYLQSPLNCSFIIGCDKVTKSAYAQILGVPVALLGSLYYLVMFFGAVLYFDRRHASILNGLSKFSVVGLIASIYFVYLQAFIIHAFCQYCLLSALTSTILFVNGLVYLKSTPAVADSNVSH